MSNFFVKSTVKIPFKVTKKFINYIKTQPISFKIYGHHHGKSAKLEAQKQAQRAPPKRMQLPSIPMSQPIRSTKFTQLSSVTTPTSPTTIYAKHDILVWFEICELALTGEYLPVLVDQASNSFMLHQGIQRRIRITVVHEPTAELNGIPFER